MLPVDNNLISLQKVNKILENVLLLNHGHCILGLTFEEALE